MKLLLDTHVWIWSQESPEKLGERSKVALLDEGNSLWVSSVSTLELARLSALGQVRLTMELGAWVEQSLRLLAADTAVVSHEIALEAYRLPEPFHRDPADRLLVATARIHGLQLLTADERIIEYRDVQTIDARS